jgi:methylphosphotriester-DNA--protein-cysteine methyltransferase
MEHLEFIDHEHFEYKYHRRWATGALSSYIDFCWETNFDNLLSEHPDGFADVLFPNIGYTYIINLGTPFVMQLEKSSLEVKNDGFIPRHHYITCHHSAGNKLFGIKFKVCPIVFEKDVDFSEYTDFVYPLAYLIDRSIVNKVKNAASFAERVDLIFQHYEELVNKHTGSLNYVSTVTEILVNSLQKKEFDNPVEKLAEKYKINNRTLQRYFRATTSFSSKQALQTMRIREAVINLAASPSSFQYFQFGYYDYSHFAKHLQQFVGDKYFKVFQELYKNAKVE